MKAGARATISLSLTRRQENTIGLALFTARTSDWPNVAGMLTICS
jgi:hypothetical protein